MRVDIYGVARALSVLLLALPLGAQAVTPPCEPTPETLRLLEAVPPLRDTAIDYESRVGALRRLAERHRDDFFVQRAYQDSFRLHRDLADEYDRALAMYRERPAESLSTYYQARLLMWSEPQRAKETFVQFLQVQPAFAWPHLDLAQLAVIPGSRVDGEFRSHTEAFLGVCPDGFGVGGSRPGIERRNSSFELALWPQIWGNEERAGEAPQILAEHIHRDLRRIEAWPFRADPDLFQVYRDAARISKDFGIMQTLRTKVERDAPNSLLALSFFQDDWEKANPVPDRNAPAIAWKKRAAKETGVHREWLRRWPNAWSLLSNLLMVLNSRVAVEALAAVSDDDLALVDQLLRMRAISPDAGECWPPAEIAIAQVYVGGKVRLDRVPALVEAGLKNIEKMYKYEYSMDLFPAEVRARATDWRSITAKLAEEVRADYLLAVRRPADARGLIARAMVRLETSEDSPQQSQERVGWLRRLANADAQEGYVESALAHYRASMAGLSRTTLAMPEAQPMVADVKQYYLAHGGTEEKWPDWATSRSGARQPEPALPSFVNDLPEFSVSDLAGRSWQLRNLKGKATFVNFWATWCGPCRSEHPGIQELYNRIKGRADVQVLTFSVDSDAASAQQYIREKGYTFPVICAPVLADRLFPYVGLPTSFVVNPQGMRTGLRAFSPDSVSIRRLIEWLETVANQGQ
jgi:thiol-disulfide isomerase/thioredoxin